ncbi:hypothetical protein QQP08_027813 [Theobroma cacao]|nr:hypothetical protein QQP08_027813 [Theobroma cacao]
MLYYSLCRFSHRCINHFVFDCGDSEVPGTHANVVFKYNGYIVLTADFMLNVFLTGAPPAPINPPSPTPPSSPEILSLVNNLCIGKGTNGVVGVLSVNDL